MFRINAEKQLPQRADVAPPILDKTQLHFIMSLPTHRAAATQCGLQVRLRRGEITTSPRVGAAVYMRDFAIITYYIVVSDFQHGITVNRPCCWAAASPRGGAAASTH